MEDQQHVTEIRPRGVYFADRLLRQLLDGVQEFGQRGLVLPTQSGDYGAEVASVTSEVIVSLVDVLAHQCRHGVEDKDCPECRNDLLSGPVNEPSCVRLGRNLRRNLCHQ